MEALALDPPAWLETLRLPILGRLLLALLLGAAVGIERELSGKPAGLRTNILICVGATLLTELSLVAASGLVEHELVRADPARIAAQIVSGIGFIGAGTILISRGSVLGLTTAATLWVVAALGMAVGLHMYVVAVGGTVLVVATLFVLGRFEARVLEERARFTLEVTLEGAESDPEQVEAYMEGEGFSLERLGHERASDAASFVYTVQGARSDRDALLRGLSRLDAVRSAAVQ